MQRISSRYEALVRQIYQINLFHPANLGLQRIRMLNEAIGTPTDSFKAVHIAGTNGKGSVALKIAKGLEASGHSTGLFVSPHISSFRERMQVNGAMISEESVENLLPPILWACEKHQIPATFFELTTALAFSHFANEKVDTAVLECGLGGLLDATNVVRPALAVITSIGLEHTRILGSTVEEIARQKAGIMKAGVPVLLTEATPVDLLRGCAAEARAVPYLTSELVSAAERRAAALPGGSGLADYDVQNTHTALAALRLLHAHGLLAKPLRLEAAGAAAAAARPPCRFEVVAAAAAPGRRRRRPRPVTCVLDVGHNPDALTLLFAKVAAAYPGRPLRVALGLSADKDLPRALEVVFRHVRDPARVHFLQAAHPRATPVLGLVNAAAELGHLVNLEDQVLGADNVEEVVRLVLARAAAAAAEEEEEEGAGAAAAAEVVVVCGSVFPMAAARTALGIQEPRDSKIIEEVAGAPLRAAQDNLIQDPTAVQAMVEKKAVFSAF